MLDFFISITIDKILSRYVYSVLLGIPESAFCSPEDALESEIKLKIHLRRFIVAPRCFL